MTTQIQQIALRTIQLEAGAIAGLSRFIDENFEKVVATISQNDGRVVISGIGKSAIIGQKIVATLNSTGTPSLFMHAADAIHGDLGMIQEKDIVIIISKSGESPEIKILVPLIKHLGNKLVAMCGNTQSFLAKQSDHLLNTTVEHEACPNNLAPTTSTTAQMVMGDALAVCLMELKGFTSDDFAKFHPGGILGKKLYLRVSDMYHHNEKPSVREHSSLKDVIVEISSKRLGATAVTDENNKLVGMITDGDLRRMLEKSQQMHEMNASMLMTKSPKTIPPDALAIEALDLMRKHSITQLIVTENGSYLGFLHLHDLIREGLI